MKSEEIAKKLIDTGNKTKNPNLIKMGEEILSKNKLNIVTKKTTSEFITTTRKEDNNKSRLVYDEQGNVIGRKTRNEPIIINKNKFVDNKIEHIIDKQNEDLKKYTKKIGLTPRTRPPAKKVTVKCHVCGKSEQVNPIHAVGSFYRCSECARKNKRT